MIVRALDVNGDWTFGAGKQNYLVNLNAVEQLITTRLKSWKYNCFFAEQDGVDWNNLLDIGTTVLLDLDIKRVILQTPGVLRIENYQSNVDTTSRTTIVTCTIDTIYGELPYQEQL